MKLHLFSVLSIIFIIGSVQVDLQNQQAAQTEELTTFILVRHAEKADESVDPDLSPEGFERAERLAAILDHVSLDAVYSTSFLRTTKTVQPITEKFGLEITEYDHRNPELQADAWKADHAGQTVLISGHSNSTPTFANALLGNKHFEDKFDESDYGNLLIITVDVNGHSKLIHLRY